MLLLLSNFQIPFVICNIVSCGLSVDDTRIIYMEYPHDVINLFLPQQCIQSKQGSIPNIGIRVYVNLLLIAFKFCSVRFIELYISSPRLNKEFCTFTNILSFHIFLKYQIYDTFKCLKSSAFLFSKNSIK